MAYGNWGAFVYKNGKRMQAWEDQTPYKEKELEPGYHQAFGSGMAGLDPCHAVLGEKRVRVCGYKNYPRIFIDGKPVEDLTEYAENKDPEYYGDNTYSGEIVLDNETYRFSALQYDDNMIDLKLTEPDGAEWTAKCGYCYGAGHSD